MEIVTSEATPSDIQIQQAEALPPSQLQQLLSELFRISLCRNDDYNLAHTGALKSLKIGGGGGGLALASKSKIIGDLTSRESERTFREKEIIKELTSAKNNLPIVEKHARKMVRKILLLTLDNNTTIKTLTGQRKIPVDSLIVTQAPSYMHVASIMNERT